MIFILPAILQKEKGDRFILLNKSVPFLHALRGNAVSDAPASQDAERPYMNSHGDHGNYQCINPNNSPHNNQQETR